MVQTHWKDKIKTIVTYKVIKRVDQFYVLQVVPFLKSYYNYNYIHYQGSPHNFFKHSAQCNLYSMV